MNRCSFRGFGRSSDEGQAMVEFALVAFFLFFLFAAMLQMIFMMHAYNTLADSAKEGIRYAIVHGTGNTQCSGPGLPSASPAVICPDLTGANVQTTVVNFAALSMQSVQTSDVTVDYNPNGANVAQCNTPGCLVRVTVSHQFHPLFGFGWPSMTLYAAADGRIMN